MYGSAQGDRHHHRPAASAEGGVGTALTDQLSTSGLSQRSSDQRGAGQTERGNRPMQATTGRTRLVAEVCRLTLRGEPLHHPAHALGGSVDLAMNRNSPPRSPSATAIAFRAFDTSMPTKISLQCPTARPTAVRIGSASPSNPRRCSVRASHLGSTDIRSYRPPTWAHHTPQPQRSAAGALISAGWYERVSPECRFWVSFPRRLTFAAHVEGSGLVCA
jgi:hypothetical protein